MTRSQRLLAGVAAAAAFLTVAASAHADVIPATLSAPAGDGSITGTFTHTGITGPNFSDDITFAWPVLGTTSASIVSVINGLNDINFTSVTLNGVALQIISSGPNESRFIGNLVTVSGQQHLLVTGSNTGNSSYSGTINFFPGEVPEPATWAMMILGMGMVGMGLRMRRREAVVLA